MPLTITIVIPVYDDWPSLERLLEDTHAELGNRELNYEILIVDDASLSTGPTASEKRGVPDNCKGIRVLRLRRNLGHQRAIAVGLVETDLKNDSDLVVVMDGDGEDSPAHIQLLIDASSANDFSSIVFARRAKRMEGPLFRWSYELYCLLHWLAVGAVPRVGNFSVVPAKFLAPLVIDSNLWNHFAATVFASRLPHTTVPIPRAKRYAGKSKLNFNALVVHGISALACYSDRIGVRAVITSSILLGLTFSGVLLVCAVRFFTPLAIPGWATMATGFLLSLSLQVLTLGFAFCLLILSRRQDVGFIPLKDAGIYILERHVL